MMTTVADRVRNVLISQFGDDADALIRIKGDSVAIRNDLVADSLDVVEISALLEEEFGLEIPDEESAALEAKPDLTVVDLIAFMDTKLATKAV